MPSAFWGLHGSPGGMIAKMPRFGLTAVQYSKGQRVEARARNAAYNPWWVDFVTHVKL